MDENLEGCENDLGWTPLHCSVGKQDIGLTTEVLKQGGKVNCCDNFGRTPLSIAASKGNLKIVELLIQEGANPNEGYPLHFSCEKGHSDVAKFLIEKGAEINFEWEHNYPLLIAASKGNLEIAKLLVERGADINVTDINKETALHWACDNGNKELISFLADQGSNLDIENKYGLTPVSICLIRHENNPDLVKVLLEKGATVNLTDVQDDTYLHHAEHPESIKELLKYGADVNAQNIYKETPLMFHSSFVSHIDCAMVLLQNNANPNIPACGGWTPLHLAAAEGHLDYVQELLKREADVNATIAENIIPLHLAAYNGHIEIVRQLVERGSLLCIPVIDIPDVNCTLPHSTARECISNGSTPLALAASKGHVEICNYLTSSGASATNLSDWPCHTMLELVRTNNLDKVKMLGEEPHIEDSNGWTLLHHSVELGFHDMSSVLLKRGISANTPDKYLRTPLSLAAFRNDSKMVDLLLENGADINLGFPLHYAVANESMDCLQKLLNSKCNVNEKNNTETKTPILVQAASRSKTDIVKILLEYAANPNSTNAWNETALHCACRLGDLEIVEVLLKHGADVNIVDSCKETALTWAAGSNNANDDIINILLERKPDINAANKFQTTALHNAAYTNFNSAAIRLINSGAFVDARNDDGETPLFLAAEHVDVLRTLIKRGADVNYRSPGGWTPLHETVSEGNVDCVRELLKSDAKVNAASAENVLPVYLAAVKGHLAVVEELLDHGSLVDPVILDIGIIRDDSGILPLSERFHIVPGNTPLIGASSKGCLDVVKLLHSRGASLNSANAEGNTALHEAVMNDFKEVVAFLLEAGVDVNKVNVDIKTALDLTDEKDLGDIVDIFTKFKISR